MKRVNNLIEKIAEPDNLRLAFWKARKGKSYSGQVVNYRSQLETNICALRKQILCGKVTIGDYRYFKIYDPKEREIVASAFREQVLHHALMNVCHHYFDRIHIFDSYASRPGKGVHAAIKRATRFSRAGRYFLKLDMRKFFASIPHNTLKIQLRRIFKDITLLDVFEKIIDSYETTTNRGLPIGNLTSQYFANHYLTGLDHYIKEKLHCKCYIRYMDDLVLWHTNKEWLKTVRNKIEGFVRLKLQLALKPILLNRCEYGLPFCGFLIYPHTVRLSQRSKRRYFEKLKYLDQQYHSGVWNEKECQRRAQSLIAFTEHADAVKFRKIFWAKHQMNNC